MRLLSQESTFNLREALENIVLSIAPQATSKGLKLDLLVSPEAPAFVRGDQRRLAQVVSHLVVNAVKFSFAGDIIIGVGCGKGDPALPNSAMEMYCQDTKERLRSASRGDGPPNGRKERSEGDVEQKRVTLQLPRRQSAKVFPSPEGKPKAASRNSSGTDAEHAATSEVVTLYVVVKDQGRGLHQDQVARLFVCECQQDGIVWFIASSV